MKPTKPNFDPPLSVNERLDRALVVLERRGIFFCREFDSCGWNALNHLPDGLRGRERRVQGFVYPRDSPQQGARLSFGVGYIADGVDEAEVGCRGVFECLFQVLMQHGLVVSRDAGAWVSVFDDLN